MESFGEWGLPLKTSAVAALPGRGCVVTDTLDKGDETMKVGASLPLITFRAKHLAHIVTFVRK